MNFDLKKLLPYIVAIIAFAIIPYVYFSPVMSGDKEIKQGDINNHKGMSKEIADFRKEHQGEEPLWTNSMFGGMPAYQISVIYNANLLKHVDSAFQLWLPHPANLVFLYFIGFYILMLCMRVNPWVALIGALGYGLSSYFFIIIEAGHNSKAHAIGYMAPLLGSILLTLRGKYLLGGGLTALFAALELYTNHLQITYYLFMIVAVLYVVEFYHAFKAKELKKIFIASAILGASLIFAILPNISSLWATYEYGKFSTRGKSELTIKRDGTSNGEIKTSGLDKDYATQWSYGIGESFSLLIPNFKGGASEPLGQHKDAIEKIDPQYRNDVAGSFYSYFGNQPFTSGPVYVGAIIIFLALLGMFIIEDRLKWVLIIATLLSLMLSWGKNMMWFSNLFFDYLPGYNKFRAVSMILIIAELTLPILAVLSIDRIINHIKNGDQILELKFLKKKITAMKLLYITFGVVGGFTLLCVIAPGLFNKFQADNEFQQMVGGAIKQNKGVTQEQAENYYTPLMEQAEIARKSIFKSDAWRSFIFIFMAAASIWLYLRKNVNKELLIGALGLFILIDLWSVDIRYLNSSNYVPKAQNQNPFPKTKADEFILEDKSLDYRVLNLSKSTFNDASTSYWHKSIGGYHGAKLKRYQELVDFKIDKDISTLYEGLGGGAISDSSLRATFAKTTILNMLNCKYVIGNPETTPIVNTQAYGNAWLVTKIKWVETADEEITALGETSPRWTAIMRSSFKEAIGTPSLEMDSISNIKLTVYQPNYLSYDSYTLKDRLAVFSEIYYSKGWNAYVDGVLTPHANANYVLRAMKVPAGKHKIEFKFEPEVYKTGEKISGIGSILILLIVGSTIFMEFRKKKSA